MNNHRFWGNHFQRDFIPNLRLLVDVLVERLLPVFDGIEKEADAKSEEAWNRYMRESGDPDDDPSTFAEWAHEVGQSHYNAMVRMRQTLLNSHAVTMYHAWEQQLLSFHRRELLHPGDENDNSLMNMKVIRKRLASEGVEVSDFASWGKIDEMRLLANTIKHADGQSADELKARRPELFEYPGFKELGFDNLRVTPRVYAPLSGEDVFVTVEEVKLYGAALLQFWEELAMAIAE